MADEERAVRARMATYERDRLKGRFPELEHLTDDLVLAIAEDVRNQQAMLTEEIREKTLDRWELQRRVDELEQEVARLRTRVKELETGP